MLTIIGIVLGLVGRLEHVVVIIDGDQAQSGDGCRHQRETGNQGQNTKFDRHM